MREPWVCIHGHFYQPPRDNPWLEVVELQDSAAPYHDWNARVTAECYHPNATSRRLAGDGRVAAIVNNYARMSFNFGPTLLAWLEEHAPGTYARVLAADRDGADRFGGHGPAIAQAYSHMILPLATARDRRTQVRWGLADFARRFGRAPEGMWLPETAVDLDTLEALAEHELRFTILAPHQALAVRPLDGSADWADVSGGRIDTTRPYRVNLPSGRNIAVFFYDGGVAQAVAFEHLLDDGERFADRLLAAGAGDGPRLLHIATDGETYGHHHHRGDMALAYATQRLEGTPGVRLTVYGEFLEAVPPTHEVQIAERTSWSCAHGVERWRSDCGCAVGHPGWGQGWRRPLRDALDGLRDASVAPFERAASELFADPWAARDGYINVILDRSAASVDAFFERYEGQPLGADERARGLGLMELQRHLQLMYTSCGWFFDDVSGLEGQQILRYAARACQLAERHLGLDVEDDLREGLAGARSNLPEQEDARAVYDRHVAPMRLDLERVAEHDVVRGLFDLHDGRNPGVAHDVFCYGIDVDERHETRVGDALLAVGRFTVRSRITTETARMVYVALRFGSHSVTGGLALEADLRDLDALRAETLALFERAAFPEVMALLARRFGADLLNLRAVFHDEQRRILDDVVRGAVTGVEQGLAQAFRDRLPLMHFLAHHGTPQPRVLRAAAEIVLNGKLAAALRRPEPGLAEVRDLVAGAARLEVPLDAASLAYVARQRVAELAGALGDGTEYDVAPLSRLRVLIDIIEVLPFAATIRAAQDRWFELLDACWSAACASADHGDQGAAAWLDAFEALGETLRCVVPDRAGAAGMT